METVFCFVVLFFLCGFALNFLSYRVLKKRVLRKRKWGLNICCGKTDGGGVNADIKKHADLPNFVLLESIYSLPFKDNQFDYVLCSHTIEHVDDPTKFYNELARVGKNVVLVIPPLWDFLASFFTIYAHKWIFLSFKKEHTKLPKFVVNPASSAFQKIFGQKIVT